MRQTVRKIAFVGEPDRNVAEALRDYGYRVDAVARGSLFAMARDIYRLRPHLIHARSDHFKAALVAKVLGLPLVVHVGRDDLNASTARAAKLAQRTLCSGASVREAIVALGAPPQRVAVVRSLLDVKSDLHAASIFPPMLDPATRWIVAATPADSPDRGHCDLLLAFLSIARARPHTKLLIAGDGHEVRKLRAQAEHAGMIARVIVHPVALEQLPAVFMRAAAVVGPSRTSAPDPVPEALAVGAPVIATAVGAHPTWIREGRTGWLVPPHAPVALAARLAAILDDPATAHKVGQAARQASIELAQPRTVAQELARCYAAVAGLAAPPRGVYSTVSAPRLVRA